jgi:hypothetical protein
VALGALAMPVCFLRAAWFMENSAWDVKPARDKGVISSFLQPLDKPVPMVVDRRQRHLGLERCTMGLRSLRSSAIVGCARIASRRGRHFARAEESVAGYKIKRH